MDAVVIEIQAQFKDDAAGAQKISSAVDRLGQSLTRASERAAAADKALASLAATARGLAGLNIEIPVDVNDSASGKLRGILDLIGQLSGGGGEGGGGAGLAGFGAALATAAANAMAFGERVLGAGEATGQAALGVSAQAAALAAGMTATAGQAAVLGAGMIATANQAATLGAGMGAAAGQASALGGRFSSLGSAAGSASSALSSFAAKLRAFRLPSFSPSAGGGAKSVGFEAGEGVEAAQERYTAAVAPSAGVSGGGRTGGVSIHLGGMRFTISAGGGEADDIVTALRAHMPQIAGEVAETVASALDRSYANAAWNA